MTGGCLCCAHDHHGKRCSICDCTRHIARRVMWRAVASKPRIARFPIVDEQGRVVPTRARR